MLKYLFSAATLVIIFSAPLQAAQYKIDPAHSFVEFRIKHLGYSWLYGRFNRVEGTLNYDSENPQSSDITVEIDTTSVDTNHAERDKHLRSGDFLDVEKFPVATFKTTSFAATDKGGTLIGKLTLHGITQDVSIEVDKIGEGKDPWDGYRAGFSGTMNLLRADYGIAYNLGPAAETLELRLGIEGIRQ